MVQDIMSVTQEDYCCPYRVIPFTRPPPPPTFDEINPSMCRMRPSECKPVCRDHWHEAQFCQDKCTRDLQLLICKNVCLSCLGGMDKKSIYQTDYALEGKDYERNLYVPSPKGKAAIMVTRKMKDDIPFETHHPLPHTGKPFPVYFTVVPRVQDIWPPLSEYQDKIGVKAMEIMYCTQKHKYHHRREVAEKIVQRKIRLIE